MILIGRNVSPFVRRVAALMRLLEIDFEQRFLATADSIDDIVKFNPLGRVHSLVLDDDEILIDSSAKISIKNRFAASPCVALRCRRAWCYGKGRGVIL